MRTVGAIAAAALSLGVAGAAVIGGGVFVAGLTVPGQAAAQTAAEQAPPVFLPPATSAEVPLVAPQEAADTDSAVADAPDDGAPDADGVEQAVTPEPVVVPPATAAETPPAAIVPLTVERLPPGVTLETALAFEPTRLGATGWSRPDVERFYGVVGVAPLWTGAGRLAAAVPAVTALIADAGAEGLDARAYPLAQLEALQAEGATGTFEVLFTDTVMKYAADRSGARLASVRLPVDMRELGRPVDSVALLVGVVNQADTAAVLAALGPQDSEYAALKALLASYRTVAAAGGWAVVPAGGAKIEPGAVDSRIPAIRARLVSTDGAAAAAEKPNHYDPLLVEAVKHFQARHGLKADGVIGKLTLEHMAKPVEYRIGQILVNMERKRQQLDDLGPNRIVVNIPEFTLRYYEDGLLNIETQVVVGRDARKTPLLQSMVTNVVLNPPWSVPAKLAGEDIVRKQINDPNYLTDHGFTIYGSGGEVVDPTTVDWTQVPRSRSIPYRMRQRPGAGNSLGRMKINFNNNYAVYLHDTPDKHLFARDMRALSSGCVRVRDPFSLGARLIRDVPGWDRARMDSTIASTTSTIFVNVVHSIGVRLTYVTAWVDAAGNAQFRQDLYGIDERIQKGLGRPILLASDS
jgi:murein L,D-transpeptidase YcbB/YkuD